MSIQVTCPSCQTTLKTADSSAGKRAKCPKCGGIIEIPAAPPAPADDEYALEAEHNPLAGFSDEELSSGPATPAATDRKPCPACGEMIVRDAVKCRYCGEVFDPVLRKQEQKARKATGEDADLSTGEWALAILCSGIGCLMGIIWMVQGKPKGKKMFLVSFAMQIVWGVIRGVIENAANR
ncbi:MAG: zf-TFIIB domain-containing protein [Planctomycetaceae bacterium]|nr:zf-TFIIB domain-containing protein [Planctomycetaceae bacterium]